MTFAEAAELAGRELVKEVSAPKPRKIPVRFRGKVVGRLHMASKATKGTVTIDRAGTFSVRPLRKHTAYSLPLDTVAELVVQRIIAAEVQKARAAKRKRR